MFANMSEQIETSDNLDVNFNVKKLFMSQEYFLQKALPNTISLKWLLYQIMHHSQRAVKENLSLFFFIELHK